MLLRQPLRKSRPGLESRMGDWGARETGRLGDWVLRLGDGTRSGHKRKTGKRGKGKKAGGGGLDYGMDYGDYGYLGYWIVGIRRSCGIGSERNEHEPHLSTSSLALMLYIHIHIHMSIYTYISYFPQLSSHHLTAPVWCRWHIENWINEKERRQETRPFFTT